MVAPICDNQLFFFNFLVIFNKCGNNPNFCQKYWTQLSHNKTKFKSRSTNATAIISRR
jgi:hypothetical protein